MPMMSTPTAVIGRLDRPTHMANFVSSSSLDRMGHPIKSGDDGVGWNVCTKRAVRALEATPIFRASQRKLGTSIPLSDNKYLGQFELALGTLGSCFRRNARGVVSSVLNQTTPISAHPREGGDPVVKITGNGTPLGSRLRGNDCGGVCKKYWNLPL